MSLKNISEAIGRGLAAGVAGTLAMTASSALEQRLRKREGSSAPADAAQKVLGVVPAGDDEKKRFASLVHYGYGTGWGALRGVIDVAGIRGPAATCVHFAVVWGSALIMLPKLEVAPPLGEWGGQELGIDALHHAIYAAATGAAYERLTSA